MSVLIVEMLSEDVVAMVEDSLDAIDVFECADIILQLPAKELIEEEDDISRLFSKAWMAGSSESILKAKFNSCQNKHY